MSIRVSLFIAGCALAGIVNAANLVPNPDFDSGLDGWSLSTGSGTMTLDSSTGLPTPPSLHLLGDNLTVTAGVQSSCIQIDDSAHVDFYMDVNRGSVGFASGGVAAYSDTACSTPLDTTIGSSANDTNGIWARYSDVDAALPAGTQSVRVILNAGMGSLGSLADVHFDHIAFGPTGSIVPAGISIDQEGLSGAWYNPGTSGQGFQFVMTPNSLPEGVGSLFGAWYTYDTTAGGADTQRWYSLESYFAGGATSAAVAIYQNTGGNFAAPPTTSAVAVGTGTLSFDSCSTGSFSYTFDDGRSGTVFLQALLSNVECVDTGTPTNPASDFGLSGTWYDPATSGQGFIIGVNPTDAQIFLSWYTYAGDAEEQGVSGQRWFTAQGPYAVGSTSMDLDVYSSTGGTFDSSDTAVTTEPVGTATLTYMNCSAATLDYDFTSGELSGQSGVITLTRLGMPLTSCDLPE